jgi:hypothetical protein
MGRRNRSRGRRNCLGWIAVVICLCFIPLGSIAEAELPRIKLAPELLDSDEADIAVGLRFEVKPKDTVYLFDKLPLDYELKGEWASEEDTNTDPIEAKVNINFDSLSDLFLGDIYFLGMLDAGYTADDRFKEQELAGGLSLGAAYENSPTFKLYLWGRYDWVYSFESEQRDRLNGDDTDDFHRLEMETLAVLRFRRLIDTPFVKNLKLSGNYRYFSQKGLDRAVDDAGQGSFDYIKFDLAYEWWPNGVFGLIQEAFVAYSYGQLPTQTEDQAVWTVGIVLYGAR